MDARHTQMRSSQQLYFITCTLVFTVIKAPGYTTVHHHQQLSTCTIAIWSLVVFQMLQYVNIIKCSDLNRTYMHT